MYCICLILVLHTERIFSSYVYKYVGMNVNKCVCMHECLQVCVHVFMYKYNMYVPGISVHYILDTIPVKQGYDSAPSYQTVPPIC